MMCCIIYVLLIFEDYQIDKLMQNKRSICKVDDCVQPNLLSLQSNSFPLNLAQKYLSQFRLDKIHPNNIHIKFQQQQVKESHVPNQIHQKSHHFKLLTSTDYKFYNDSLNTKDQQREKASIGRPKNKISHIFNIKSINLVDKSKYDKQKPCFDRFHIKQKFSSKEYKRNLLQKENLKGLNLILVDKKYDVSTSPGKRLIRSGQKKNSMEYLPSKNNQGKSFVLVKNGDSQFDQKINEYYSYLRQHSRAHGLELQCIENYPKNSLFYYVGKGNNGHLIKELLKKRWWWNLTEDKSKKESNFLWTQLKQKDYYQKSQKIIVESKSRKSLNRIKTQGEPQQIIINNSSIMKAFNSQTYIHNHFENNQFLGNKKALFYNMKQFYEKEGKNVFDYLPLTFHVKRYNDQVWQEFTRYYFQDLKSNGQGCRLWIVKPGENSNRGTGITIYSEYDKIKQWVENEISGENNPKKTFIIQKYIDKPFLYNKRKFDIRCYMLLVRLNGKIKGYWYNQGYIRTSCFEFQLKDTENQFIHLTNDAIQVNSQKYGKYQDGNKLSYHNFQKYLKNSRLNHNFFEEICPELKKIGTESIEATYHLLGKWDGKPTFQIFGLDFMIDEDFKPWLIEINTNPCLQTSSATLERIIPRMVDNAFKLSLDLLFPPPMNWQNSKKHHMPNKVSTNLFEMIFDEQKKAQGHRVSHDMILEMGQIEEDNEVYQQTNFNVKKDKES